MDMVSAFQLTPSETAELREAARKTDDEIVVIEVPVNAPGGQRRADRPPEINELCSESDNRWNKQTGKCICVMEVRKELVAEMRKRIAAYPDSVVKEITPEKEATAREDFPEYDEVKQRVVDNIAGKVGKLG